MHLLKNMTKEMSKIGFAGKKKSCFNIYIFKLKNALFYFPGYLNYNNVNPHTLQQSGPYTCKLPRNIIRFQKEMAMNVSNVNKDSGLHCSTVFLENRLSVSSHICQCKFLLFVSKPRKKLSTQKKDRKCLEKNSYRI